MYEREVPFELRKNESASTAQSGILEAVRVKVLVMGEDGAVQDVRVEISAESDLFFHYFHEMNEQAFQAFKQQQKLMVDFAEYPSTLVRMLNNCIKEPNSFFTLFVYDEEGNGRVDFVQNLEYKYVDLLSLDFVATPMDQLKNHIHFRYNALKSRLTSYKSQLQEVNNLLKLNNPALLLKLQKSPAPSTHTPASFMSMSSSGMRNTSARKL